MRTLSIKLKPFQVPNFVIEDAPPRPRQLGFQDSVSYPLSEVPHDTLISMCEDFKATVLSMAGADRNKIEP